MTEMTREGIILGNAGIINSEKKILHNQRLGKVIYKKDINADYLFHYLNSRLFKKQIMRTAAGGTGVIHTSKEKILECFIPIPSPTEQADIAKIFNKIDTLSRITQEYNSNVMDLKKSTKQRILFME